MTAKETSWNPRITTGLSGARYPEEDLEPHTPDGRTMKSPGVYILKCSQPSDWETVVERWETHYEVDIPDFIETAFHASGVLYVGGAESVLDRIHEHLEAPNRSASILHVYPVHSIFGVEWTDDKETAFEKESQIALDLQNNMPDDWLVFQN